MDLFLDSDSDADVPANPEYDEAAVDSSGNSDSEQVSQATVLAVVQATVQSRKFLKKTKRQKQMPKDNVWWHKYAK